MNGIKNYFDSICLQMKSHSKDQNNLSLVQEFEPRTIFVMNNYITDDVSNILNDG